MDPLAGLLDPQARRQSKNMGLLAAGLSLMADSGWSTEPQDTLSNVARAGLTGLQTYMGSNERALEAQQYRQAQMAEQARAQQLAQQEAAMKRAAEMAAQSATYTPQQQAALGIMAQANPSSVLDRYVADAFPERDMRVVGDALVDVSTGQAVYKKGPDPLLPTTGTPIGGLAFPSGRPRTN